MSIEGRIESLKRKHINLHARIEVFEAEKVPEHYIIALKKEKLKIKDELLLLGGKV
jgi:hypothetical protein